MKHNFQYEYGRVVLCPLEEKDIEELRILRNSKRDCFLTQDIISAEAQKQWYSRYLQEENDFMFRIAKKENDIEFIGAIALYDINFTSKSAEFGRLIIDKQKCLEKGLGTEAVKAVTYFGFNVLKLDKIRAEVLKNNTPAIISYERAGYSIIDNSNKSVIFMEIDNPKKEFL